MSRKQLKKNVIKYLQQRDYKYVKCLGDGGFGSVIAMMTPEKEEVAVKIVEGSKLWVIEDTFWQDFCHPHILSIKKTMPINELDVKLYFMPILPKVLIDTLVEKQFKRDSCSFNRIKKWFRQILSALSYLHHAGYCHLDVKSDNVMLDNEDNAVLGDFSCLNFTGVPVDRICAPLNLRPKECFPVDGMLDVRGKPYDVWTFGLLALNVLTGHYPELKGPKVNPDSDWGEVVWPILESALDEEKFKSLIKKAFPRACLTNTDVHEALNFVKFIMKVQPDERPDVSRIKKHPFLKIDSNPFYRDLREKAWKKRNCYNPFQNIDLYNSASENISKQPGLKTESVTIQPKMESAETQPTTISPAIQFKSFPAEDKCSKDKCPEVPIEEYNCSGTRSSDAQDNSASIVNENKSFGKTVKSWFQTQFSKMFRRKKK